MIGWSFLQILLKVLNSEVSHSFRSRKKSVSYDSISSLSNSPEGRARSVAMASDVDKLVDVKIIDFAHSTHRGLRDATLHEVHRPKQEYKCLIPAQLIYEGGCFEKVNNDRTPL